MSVHAKPVAARTTGISFGIVDLRGGEVRPAGPSVAQQQQQPKLVHNRAMER